MLARLVRDRPVLLLHRDLRRGCITPFLGSAPRCRPRASAGDAPPSERTLVNGGAHRFPASEEQQPDADDRQKGDDREPQRHDDGWALDSQRIGKRLRQHRGVIEPVGGTWRKHCGPSKDVAREKLVKGARRRHLTR
jgi:hypothetical protein